MADEKKEKEASAAVAHLIWFPDAGGYQVPFDKQTQWVCTAKSPYVCVWVACVSACVLSSTKVLLQASQTTHGVVLFFLTVCVRSDTVYDGTSCRQHSKCTCGHAYMPAHPHLCLLKKRQKKICFLTANHISSPHRRTTLQTCWREWCRLHLYQM